jgi:hypothetical protein
VFGAQLHRHLRHFLNRHCLARFCLHITPDATTL